MNGNSSRVCVTDLVSCKRSLIQPGLLLLLTQDFPSHILQCKIFYNSSEGVGVIVIIIIAVVYRKRIDIRIVERTCLCSRRKLNHWPPCEKRYFAYWLATRSKTDMLFIAKNAFILNSIDVNQQPILSSRKVNNHKQGKVLLRRWKSMKPISKDDEVHETHFER
ncbi:hypothetical protein SUGI_0052630 [Cryptomeria japonica]|nr:hypothetical protein SUGI_0052630 [Cryptomeria japonica]